MIEFETTDLGALQRYSDAARRLLGQRADWKGFEFSADPGNGVWVRGRRGQHGRPSTVFVPLSEIQS